MMKKLALWVVFAACAVVAPTFAQAACQGSFAGTVGGPVIHITVMDKTCTVAADPTKVSWATGVFTANATQVVNGTGFDFTCTRISGVNWTATHADGGTGVMPLTCTSAFSTGPLTFGP